MIFRIGLFTLVGGLSGILSWWTFDRASPITIVKASPVNVSVAPGDLLKIEFEYVRHRNCKVKVDRYIQDSGNVRYTLTNEGFQSLAGLEGFAQVVIPLQIPRNVGEGKAKYISVRNYVCNPIQAIWPLVVDGPVVEFEIVGPPVPLPVEIDRWLKK